jgi:hypothetical protein
MKPVTKIIIKLEDRELSLNPKECRMLRRVLNELLEPEDAKLKGRQDRALLNHPPLPGAFRKLQEHMEKLQREPRKEYVPVPYPVPAAPIYPGPGWSPTEVWCGDIPPSLAPQTTCIATGTVSTPGNLTLGGTLMIDAARDLTCVRD